MNHIEILPSWDSFSNLASKGNLIPVYADFIADQETPVSAYLKVRNHQPSFLFESITGGEQISRYSFIGIDPRKIFSIRSDKTEVQLSDGSQHIIPTPPDPLSIIEHEMSTYRPVNLPELSHFTGGAVGFIGYEYVHHLEPTVPRSPHDELDLPTLYFLITHTLIIFDHAKQVLRICTQAFIPSDTQSSTVSTSDNPVRSAYEKAILKIHEIASFLKKRSKLALTSFQKDATSDFSPSSNFSQKEYESLLAEVKKFILEGDIFQVVLSQRFSTPFESCPLNLYRILRTINPSPYMFIIETKGFSIVGASPEVHVKLSGSTAEIHPIAGTIPRGKNPEEDLAQEKALLQNEKEVAEHLMLVDLARNDLGRVCKPGSIDVAKYQNIEYYSHVMHMVSQVLGELASHKNAFDLMRATFPAGTLTGAPKVRAMQIISEVEPSQRGVYGGALGYFGYNGDLNTCIAIRTAIIKDKKAYIQAGGGIVQDSDPHREYLETVNKAQGMLKAIGINQETFPSLRNTHLE